MVKLKNVILVTVIGLAVLFSGCAGTQENKVTETANPTPAEQTAAVQTPAGQTPAAGTPAGPYQVQVTEVKNLPDCIVALGTTQSCSIVNLEIKNNDIKSLDVQILKNAIVLKGGNSLQKYESEAGLNAQCVRRPGMEFKLNANAAQNIGLCYPSLHKTDNPTLNVEVMINGDRKVSTFDLTQYGLN
ncbi:MAG: hypothetical protein OIN85_07895 [Candidatus Methanoperedens sp.]|nr:hypothetical protein [Candidatus Methanoperedens sp.]